MGYQNRKKGDLYQGILEWICKELIPVPHKAEALLNVLEERIMSCKDEKVHSYFGMALDAAGVCRGSIWIDQEQMAKTFLNSFLIWCEKVRRNDISVFGINWDLFDKDVWGDLTENLTTGTNNFIVNSISAGGTERKYIIEIEKNKDNNTNLYVRVVLLNTVI